MAVQSDPGTLLSDPQQLNEAVRPLVWRAQAGDEEAFTRLVGWCYQQIHRWALGLTGDPDDADDVTQEVLVALHWNLRSFEQRSRFTTWLYRITRNSALALLRKRQRRERRKRQARHENPGQTTEETDRLESLYASDVAELVRTLFQELPDRQRDVFDLVDLQGHTPTEVAEMLDMKPVTVRAHLHRARRTIRTAILDRHPEIAEEYHR
jgi:RNA polymerase sigma-70 factor (ECF subfamily)